MKSKMEDVIEATRIVNKLDKRGKLAILRDLQKQGLEVAKPVVERRNFTASSVSGIELITGTGAKVPVTYTQGEER